MEKIFIDAENAVRGRVASFAAKKALQGFEVNVVNSEKALISGSNKNIIKEFKELRALNSINPGKGPLVSKNPEKIMKRCIRGMLPDYRTGRAREAWKRIKCYIGVPEEFKKEKLIKTSEKEKHPKKTMTIELLSKRA
jgi:large subunit ribosomal protein L13